ncbi:metallophosphoesterase family protein [uncultured Sphingomonas sp.]|uniref:metallophosphoesterase family protein n=1 Tax=uncultured Sphingomonas sp. TaxID=158754 RepID=UPI002623D424|nr:metallophosphoesterase family protein [uncultured Sphingomonas sp.]
MLRKLFRGARSTAATPPPMIPPGERVYAIGDVHGCAAQLERLLAMIADDEAGRGPAETTIILLGDLVDRGPASAQAIEQLIALRHRAPNTRFIAGNHEEVFLHAIDGDEQALRMFCRIGGRETIMSYGVTGPEYERLDYAELAAELERIVPATHVDFLRSFEDVVTVGDYAFVHAGIRPNIALALQKTSDLRWIRGTFLDFAGRHEKMIVHGHTITPEVERKAGRIGIDTGAYAGGPLTALGLEGDESWVLQASA